MPIFRILQDIFMWLVITAVYVAFGVRIAQTQEFNGTTLIIFLLLVLLNICVMIGLSVQSYHEYKKTERKNKISHYVLKLAAAATPFIAVGTNLFLLEKPRGPLLIFFLIIMLLCLLVIIEFARKLYREYKENVRKEA